MKQGWRTTEFWITLLAVVGAVATAVAGVLPPEQALKWGAVATVAYNLSRGLAKLFVIDGRGASVFPQPSEAPSATGVAIVPAPGASAVEENHEAG